MSRRLLAWGLPLLALLALVLAVLSIQRSNAARAQAAPPAPALAAPVAAEPVIGGLGQVEPLGGEVSLSPEVAGVVAEVLVAPGDRVARGQPLFALDPAQADAAVAQAEADVAAAEARLAEQRAMSAKAAADLDAAREAVAAAQVALEDAEADARVGRDLAAGAVIPAREQEGRERAVATARALLLQRRAEAMRAEAAYRLLDPEAGGATLAVAAAAVAQARAALAAAEVARGLLSVAAPGDAVVLAVDVRPGEFVQPGADPAPVTLGASDLVLRVQVDEEDLGRLSDAPAGYALRRGAEGARVPLRFLRAEPRVVPKANLSGEAGERVDTRVLELLFGLPADAGTLRVGETLDAFVEAREGA